MQRYKPHDDGDGLAYGVPCKDGAYVRFDEALRRIEALERENARLRGALIEVADTLEFQYRGVNPPMDRWLHDPKSAILRAKEALS